jgi:hypothetical protein
VVVQVKADVVEHARAKARKDVVAPDAAGRCGDQAKQQSAEHQREQQAGLLGHRSVDQKLKAQRYHDAEDVLDQQPDEEQRERALVAEAVAREEA